MLSLVSSTRVSSTLRLSRMAKLKHNIIPGLPLVSSTKTTPNYARGTKQDITSPLTYIYSNRTTKTSTTRNEKAIYIVYPKYKCDSVIFTIPSNAIGRGLSGKDMLAGTDKTKVTIECGPTSPGCPRNGPTNSKEDNRRKLAPITSSEPYMKKGHGDGINITPFAMTSWIYRQAKRPW